MPSPKLWIVIPTYNERATIQSLLQKPALIGPADILIVDDNSPDGTGQLIEELRRHQPHLHLLHRPSKAGLSAAYHHGLQEAINRGAEQIVHLDADGSHDPALIPKMVTLLAEADVVVASRYIPGGQFAVPSHRRWISVLGNWYMRLLLGQTVHDWSAGFMAWRGPMLQAVLRQSWQSVGYAGLIEMKWLARRLEARFAEVPLRFTDRRLGQSKFTTAIMREDLRLAWRLWQRRGQPLHQAKK